jgi:hypothetical protein
VLADVCVTFLHTSILFLIETAENYLRVFSALVSYHVDIGKASSACLGTEDSASVKRDSLLVVITYAMYTYFNNQERR